MPLIDVLKCFLLYQVQVHDRKTSAALIGSYLEDIPNDGLELHVCQEKVSSTLSTFEKEPRQFPFCSAVQNDADLELAPAAAPALLHSGQGEPGEGHPLQAALPAGLRGEGLPLRGTRVLEGQSAGHPRPLLLLVRPKLHCSALKSPVH